MKRRLVVPGSTWSRWMDHLGGSRLERMCFGFGGISESSAGVDYLVSRGEAPSDDRYVTHGVGSVTLHARYAVRCLLEAAQHRFLADVHSHPSGAGPWPSATDRAGAEEQRRSLGHAAPSAALVRLIVCDGDVWAAVHEGSGPPQPFDEIVVEGLAGRQSVRPVNSPAPRSRPASRENPRTEAVMGATSAREVSETDVAVIGAGGVGSAVIAQLQGYVRGMVIVDPDVVEVHNAPRLHHYRAGDEGRFKADVQARGVRDAFPDVEVAALTLPFPEPETVDRIKRADMVFCCPDSNAVRYAAARMAARYHLPLIEVGCGGRRGGDGTIEALGYHVRIQIPDGPCLVCAGMGSDGIEDPESTRVKARAGYVENGDLVQGELVTLTTRAAADAVDLFFRYVTGYVPGAIPLQIYHDALAMRTVDLRFPPQADCTICGVPARSGPDRIFGRGDAVGEDHAILPPPGQEETSRVV